MCDDFCTSAGYPQRKDSFSQVKDEHSDVDDQRTKAFRHCVDIKELSRLVNDSRTRVWKERVRQAT